MKKFTLLEKQLLQEIISSEMYHAQGVIRPSVFLDEYHVGPDHDLSILFGPDCHKVMVSYPKRDSNETAPLLLIVTFVHLLKRLEHDGLIYWVSEPLEKTVNKAQGSQYTDGNNILLPSSIGGYLQDQFTNIFTPTEDLLDLVKNNFTTPDERRFLWTLRVSIAALVLSALLGLWGIYRDVNQVDSVPSPEDTHIQVSSGDSLPELGNDIMPKKPNSADKTEQHGGANSDSAPVVPPSAPSE